MSGSTHGDRKLRSPAVNAMRMPTDADDSCMTASTLPEGEPPPPPRLRDRLLRWYYAMKYRAFRRERRPDDGRRGLIALQIDALAYADLRRAIAAGWCPTIARLANDESYVL